MSIILRDQQGNIKLYCKGADNMILARLADTDENHIIMNETINHLESYAQNGLRTLLLSYKLIDPHEYEVILKIWS